MKYYEALKHAREGKLSIVTPDWIVNSLQAGQRSAEAPYHPRLLTLRGQTPVMPAMHKKQRMKPKKLMLPTMENTPASASPLASSHPQLLTTAAAVAATPSPAATCIGKRSVKALRQVAPASRHNYTTTGPGLIQRKSKSVKINYYVTAHTQSQNTTEKTRVHLTEV